MKKTLALIVCLLLAVSGLCAQAETVLWGNGFHMTLDDGWTVMDASLQAQIARLASGEAQSGVAAAASDGGAVLCAFLQPSQGMNAYFMALFQSEYIRRAEEAIAPLKAQDVSGSEIACGENEFYCLSFTAGGASLSMYYYFTDAVVVTVVFSNADAEEASRILSTLAVDELAISPLS